MYFWPNSSHFTPSPPACWNGMCTCFCTGTSTTWSSYSTWGTSTIFCTFWTNGTCTCFVTGTSTSCSSISIWGTSSEETHTPSQETPKLIFLKSRNGWKSLLRPSFHNLLHLLDHRHLDMLGHRHFHHLLLHFDLRNVYHFLNFLNHWHLK